MKIALIGYGKMGKIVHQIAASQGHSIVAIIDSTNTLKTQASFDAIAQAEICIDFSIPQCVLENVTAIASLKKNLILGTTGWTEHLEKVKAVVKNEEIGLLYSPNFSIGVALFLKLLDKAAEYMAPFKDYEAAGIEMHHSQKLDAPSGTAKQIEKTLSHHFSKPINFSSIRVGKVPGTHTVLFDSAFDTITLTHTARNREGFAKGAIAAGEWLRGKKGVYTLEDFIKTQNFD